MRTQYAPNHYELHNGKNGFTVFFIGRERLESLKNNLYLSESKTKTLVKNAINGTLILLRNELDRMAKARFNIKDIDIKRKIHLRKASAQSYYDGSLYIYKDKGLPLAYYLGSSQKVPNYREIKPSQRKPVGGAPVKVYKDKPAKVYTGPGNLTPFLAELQSKFKYSRQSNIGVFYRYGSGNFFSYSKNGMRYHRKGEHTDIAELFGPSPVNIIFHEDAQKKIMQKADEMLDYKINNIVAKAIAKQLGR